MSVRSAWSGSWPTLDARIRLTSPTGRCRIRTTLSHLLDDALYGSGQYLVSRGEWGLCVWAERTLLPSRLCEIQAVLQSPHCMTSVDPDGGVVRAAEGPREIAVSRRAVP
jgi:hypothetical protein